MGTGKQNRVVVGKRRINEEEQYVQERLAGLRVTVSRPVGDARRTELGRYKWEREFLASMSKDSRGEAATPMSAVERRALVRRQEICAAIIERDVAKGWKEMAFFLGMDESNLRAAYRDEPHVRQAIHKTGGRYWAHPGMLMNLEGTLANRREGGEARRKFARSRVRGDKGKFVRVS